MFEVVVVVPSMKLCTIGDVAFFVFRHDVMISSDLRWEGKDIELANCGEIDVLMS